MSRGDGTSTGGWDATGPLSRSREYSAAKPPLRASLLDRLTDDEPTVNVEARLTYEESLTAFRASVKQHLVWLLNTRRSNIRIDSGCTAVRASLLRYGITDVTSLSRDGSETLARLVREVEEAITLFEPRLTDVRVRAESGFGSASTTHQLRFTIDAMLRVDKGKERVVFDTVLDAANGKYLIPDEERSGDA